MGFQATLLCDGETDYVYGILFDAGKKYKSLIQEEVQISFAQTVVMLDGIGKGHILFIDSWYYLLL